MNAISLSQPLDTASQDVAESSSLKKRKLKKLALRQLRNALVLGFGLIQLAMTSNVYANGNTKACMQNVFNTINPMLTGWTSFESDMSNGRPAPFTSGCSPWAITSPLNLANTGITATNSASCINAIALSFMGSSLTNVGIIRQEMGSNIGKWQAQKCDSNGNYVGDSGTYKCPLSQSYLQDTVGGALQNCYKTAY